MAEGFKDFAPGDILTAADVDDYLMQQSVMVFADSSARTTALSSVLREGMMSYLKDTDTVEVYDGSAWVGVGGVGTANFTDTATGTYWSGGVDYKYITFTASGTITFDTDGLATCLIVGAGGGSGYGPSGNPGGGGGGGQLLEGDFYFTAGTYTVVVGAGGAAGTGGSDRQQGRAGFVSELGQYISSAGGGGEGVYTFNDAPGASGGGGASTNAKTTGNPPFSAQTGYAGGNGNGTTVSGGGGGAGGAGGTPTAGLGASSSITNTPVTYCAGGAGNTLTAGGANTGDGGGGGSAGARAGGSGIVIVRVVV